MTLSTLHGSKGLEFDVVFLIGCEEGYLPHARTLDARATDDAGRGRRRTSRRSGASSTSASPARATSWCSRARGRASCAARPCRARRAAFSWTSRRSCSKSSERDRRGADDDARGRGQRRGHPRHAGAVAVARALQRQRALHVLHQVGLVLDADAEPHQPVGDADGGALLGASSRSSSSPRAARRASPRRRSSGRCARASWRRPRGWPPRGRPSRRSSPRRRSRASAPGRWRGWDARRAPGRRRARREGASPGAARARAPSRSAARRAARAS